MTNTHRYSFRSEETYKDTIVVAQGESGIADLFFAVDPATVGQCIGLRDKNEQLIFEGDVLLSESHRGHEDLYQESLFGAVVWDDEQCAFYISDPADYFRMDDVFYDSDVTVKGNVHDNPELLGEVPAG